MAIQRRTRVSQASGPSIGPSTTATVSVDLARDWLDSLRAICSTVELDSCFRSAGIVKAFLDRPGHRLTHDQIVKLYQESAAVTGDEMMGLWSRPIRTGSLKYIVRAVVDAPSIRVALYRFTQVWNLLLDDFRLELRDGTDELRVLLIERTRAARVNRFGHALMLKLTHGIGSWLVGNEIPVQAVRFVFDRPDFAGDYPILFPGPVSFRNSVSEIVFNKDVGKIRARRSAQEARSFLERAPRDWIFTSSYDHALQLRVRELLYGDLGRGLGDVSNRLHQSSRTLIRRLQREGHSFQQIKDELRRDLAILHLARNDISLAEISDALSFSSPAVFHRAFRAWTGVTPGAYRVAQGELQSRSGVAPS